MATETRALTHYDSRITLPMSRTTTYPAGDGDLTTIHAPETTPNDALAAAHHDLLVEHWTEIAAASYFGFKRFGIGAVVIQPREGQSDAHAFDTHRLAYCRDSSPWLRQQKDALPADWLDDQLQSYDPNTTVLVLITTENSGGDAPEARVYAAEATPAPPEAFQIARASQN